MFYCGQYEWAAFHNSTWSYLKIIELLKESRDFVQGIAFVFSTLKSYLFHSKKSML